MSTKQHHPAGSVDGSLELSRYDLLLLAIPIPLVSGLLAGVVAPGPVVEELGAGAVLAVLLMAYGLFIDAPV
jgi:hypothetical protein